MEAQSLDEVRANIDRLDRDIIPLLAERGRHVRRAAHFKVNAADVAAPQRVEHVIAKIRELATANGLDERVAEATYRAMIGAFIEMEREVYQALQI